MVDPIAKHRTATEIHFEANLLETSEPPLYQKIAEEANRLLRLGMSKSAIARHFRTDKNLVMKSLEWWGKNA